MPYKVTISAEARQQLFTMPDAIRLRVLNVIERLEKWPSVSGVKHLTKEWKGFARVRTGDYRVIFRVVKDDEIAVLRIANRRDAYAD